MIFVVALPSTIAAIIFAVLWLSSERRCHRIETQRDHYWDMCMQAGLIMAAQIAEEKTHGS